MAEQSLIAEVEIWKTIPSTDGFYEASSLGRVRRAKRGIKGGQIGYILTPQVNWAGYLRVVTRRDNKSLRRCIHCLVAEAFLGSRPSGLEINHMDGHKGNNRPENLEYCSKSHNMLHAYAVGLISHGFKLHESDVVKIRQNAAHGVPQKAIANMFGISEPTVSEIVNRKTWRHVARPIQPVQ